MLRARNYPGRMDKTQWWTYVLQVIGDDTQQEAARRCGFDKSNFTRWKNGANAEAAFAVKLARAYGVNVIQALVACGVLTEHEAQLRTVTEMPRETSARLTDQQLISELARRIDGNPAAWEGTFGEVLESADDTEVGPTADSGLQGVVTAIAGKLDIENGDQRGQQMG